MYICKECGQQYKTKPLYCNCGNDEFQEPQNIKTMAKKYLEKMGVSLFAILFFATCIVLSLFILFMFNPQKNSNTKTEIKTVQTKTNIPNIDMLWVEPAPKTDSTQVVSKPVVEEKAIKTVKKVDTQKSTNTNTVNNKTKSQSQLKPQSTNTNNIQTKNITQTAQQKTKSNSINVTDEQKTVSNEISQKDNQELYNYKIKLRQALFSKLSVISIQGSGECGIEFSINSTGKLINRNFTYQSDNKTINDEVYKMLMRLPQYYPPPTSYNGEKIKMVFSFDNGSYSINYTN